MNTIPPSRECLLQLAFSSPFLCNYAVFSALCSLSPYARALYYYTEQKSGSLTAICSTMACGSFIVMVANFEQSLYRDE